MGWWGCWVSAVEMEGGEGGGAEGREETLHVADEVALGSWITRSASAEEGVCEIQGQDGGLGRGEG